MTNTTKKRLLKKHKELVGIWIWAIDSYYNWEINVSGQVTYQGLVWGYVKDNDIIQLGSGRCKNLV
jgi:hypothetical protein